MDTNDPMDVSESASSPWRAVDVGNIESTHPEWSMSFIQASGSINKPDTSTTLLIETAGGEAVAKRMAPMIVFVLELVVLDLLILLYCQVIETTVGGTITSQWSHLISEDNETASKFGSNVAKVSARNWPPS